MRAVVYAAIAFQCVLILAILLAFCYIGPRHSRDEDIRDKQTGKYIYIRRRVAASGMILCLSASVLSCFLFADVASYDDSRIMGQGNQHIRRGNVRGPNLHSFAPSTEPQPTDPTSASRRRLG